MMKAAIMQVNIVNTVSPSYAMEIHDPWFSHGLDPILNAKGDRVVGILNGIDVQANNQRPTRTSTKIMTSIRWRISRSTRSS